MKEDQVMLQVEVLEERIAPSTTGQCGYERQPGNQTNGQGNPPGPEGSNPEGPEGRRGTLR